MFDRLVARAAMSSGPASRLTGMEAERGTASITIEAVSEAVFAVLADPSAHAAIDGTGWVREYIQFPPFGPDHVDNSLQHLSDLVA
jgi:predicted RNA methylase